MAQREKKRVLDAVNFLCAQLYLLLDDITATVLEASSVSERR
jgi:hypothetical protein